MRYLLTIFTIGITCLAVLWLKSPRSPQLFGTCVSRVKTEEKIVALTFDDGPSSYTEPLLAALRQYGVKATFFLLGNHAETHPELVRQIYTDGHEIGNHSYSHQPLIFRSASFIREEIEKTDQIIRRAGYTGPIHFRAPYGRKLVALPRILKEMHRPHILFDVIPDDWASPGISLIVSRIVEKVRPGSIVLCHDGSESGVEQDRSQTVEAMPIMIEKLKKEGYRFVTISELLQATRHLPQKNRSRAMGNQESAPEPHPQTAPY